jgi:hypothetical protein
MIMATTPEDEEPGFETDVDELPAGPEKGREDTLEDSPAPNKDESQATEMEYVQEEAAEERKEGGYQ